MILRTYHISVIAVFLVFTNARTVQSVTQNETIKQPESPYIFGRMGTLLHPILSSMVQDLLSATPQQLLQHNPYHVHNSYNPYHQFPSSPWPCRDFWYQYALITNIRSKKFGSGYWDLPGSNSPWRPCSLYFYVKPGK